jgi:hypothetical protein
MKIKYSVIIALFAGLSATAQAQSTSRDSMNNPGIEPASAAEMVISRSDYIRRLEGFWLGQNVANRTSIVTENVRQEAPFYTDEDWGLKKGRNGKLIDWVLVLEGETFTADDDTDIEYMYQHTMYNKKKSILSPEDIRDAWLNHIEVHESGHPGPWKGKVGQPSWLWGSNREAFNLMRKTEILPPATSLPKNNKKGDLIDAQLTTEIFGVFAPARPDVAMEIAYLPVRTVAYQEAEWISQFYIIMHSLASYVAPDLSMHEKTVWLAEEARKRLPDESVSAHMYDFIKADYANNPDKNNWEKTRDAVYQNYQINGDAGYKHTSGIGSEINFAAGMVSFFYGQGDYKRTVVIGTLCGWDSDNPTSTWGGLLGFLIGVDGVKNLFPDKELSGLYQISHKRINFPDHTPNLPGEDTFELLSERGAEIIDRLVVEEMNGRVDLVKGKWTIPNPGAKHITPAEYFSR